MCYQIRKALHLLTLAGIVTPVVATAANGFPLDAETDERRIKYLFLDPGLLLATLRLDGNVSQELVRLIEHHLSLCVATYIPLDYIHCVKSDCKITLVPRFTKQAADILPSL